MSTSSTKILTPIHDWFTQQEWKPIAFQKKTWKAYLSGESGIIQVPTGSGKTYGAVMGPIAQMLAEREKTGKPLSGLHLLYITPLRALSRDIEVSIKRPIEEMGWPITVESRTGDTKSSVKTRQIKKMPNILITTPESLAVLLSYKNSARRFGLLRCVILDEWHELMASKRGTQAELCMSRLRELNGTVQTWAISATLGNLQEAAEAATGLGSDPVIVQSKIERKTVITSVLPESVDSFPWAGHLGLRMFEELVAALDIDRSTLIFTNTRSQAEKWFQALTFSMPDDEEKIALHHGSIDFETRLGIEAGLKEGKIKWVVCTSSLDLGVDFQPVERVVQVGSAKNLARLLQRAGRSAHLPGGTSEVFFLPTNALELLEISAFRRGLMKGDIESRHTLNKPYDVLLQHLVTLACGDGFKPEETFESVKKTFSYQDLTLEEFGWMVDFLEKGGKCLKAYPRYQKIVLGEDGAYRVEDAKIMRMHKMSIGTITGNQQIKIAYAKGGRIGTVEENFVSRLKKGDVFFFAGRQLEYFQMKDMTLYVKNAKKKSSVIPAWSGSYLAISDRLSQYIREEITQAKEGNVSEEVACIMPILATQDRISHLPEANQYLMECCRTREGQHLYAYPFEGRNVHEGLGFLWAYRFSQLKKATFTVSVNDYGFEILAAKDYPFKALFDESFFSTRNLYEEIRESLNISELTQRRFRGISQVSGLVFKGYPSAKKTANQVQISSSLIYDVFNKYEPENLLLQQAEREVIETQLEEPRLTAALKRMKAMELVWMDVKRPSPFGFPLLVERLSSRLTNESLRDRIERMKKQWDR